MVSALELRDYSSAHDWLISGFIESNALALLFGDPGAGKSLLALDWAASIATGRDWYGRKTRQGAAFYAAGEGFRGMKRRLAAWAKATGIEAVWGDAFWEMPFFLCECSAGLPHELDALIEAIDGAAARQKNLSLVVIDTLARCLVGNENSADDMAEFIAACDELRRRFECTVLVVHHSGHGDKTRARGYSSLPAAMDVIFQLEAGKGGERGLVCTKAKDFEPPADLRFTVQSLPLPGTGPNGEPVTAPVLVNSTPRLAAPNNSQANGFAKNSFAGAAVPWLSPAKLDPNPWPGADGAVPGQLKASEVYD